MKKILIFNESELALLGKIEKQNSDELIFWKLPNIIYPFAVIFISLLCYLIFKPVEKITAVGFVNLLFNGSLPMVALNRMSSLGSNLFKFDKARELQAKTNTTHLRVKIDDCSKILLLGIVILYIYQVIGNPFVCSGWMILQIVASAVFIFLALKLSKYGYLLQEKLLETTLGDIIKEESNQGKKHLSEKYQ
jgi:hypothetical protein